MAVSSVSVQSSELADPDSIKFLLDPKQEYSFYYVVGNGKSGTSVERIGVVKKMLLANSEVFRRKLQDSNIRDENNTEISDIFPDTFKNMLRYVYGFDNTASLSFEDADDLLYAADKYMIYGLKARLATRLMGLLSCENICSLMNNPAVYRVLELNNEITRIIQFETDKVLNSPQFLELCPDAFLKILEQEQLHAPEIELWRAAVKWAKNRVDSEDGPTLRKELVRHVKNIRMCTLSHEDFCRDVVPTKILGYKEVFQLCMYHGNKDFKPDLKAICDVVETRIITTRYEKSELMYFRFNNLNCYNYSTQKSITIITKESRLELSSVVVGQYQTYSLCNFTIKIEQISTTTEPQTPVTITRYKQQASNREFVISICNDDDDDSLHLLPHSKYKVTITSNQYIITYYNPTTNISTRNGNDFDVQHEYDSSGYYLTCIKIVDYKTIKIK